MGEMIVGIALLFCISTLVYHHIGYSKAVAVIREYQSQQQYSEAITHLKWLLEDAKNNIREEAAYSAGHCNPSEQRGYLSGIKGAIYRLEMNSVKTSKGGE